MIKLYDGALVQVDGIVKPEIAKARPDGFFMIGGYKYRRDGRRAERAAPALLLMYSQGCTV